MDDQFYKVVRLKTGETILCTMYKKGNAFFGDPHLILIEPVQIIPMTETKKGGDILSEAFSLRPWIGLSDSDEFYIPSDIVLTVGDQKRDVQNQYIEYTTQTVRSKNKMKQRYEIEDAAIQLLNEITMGNLQIIDLEDYNEEG